MVDGMSIREASRVFGVHCKTVRKMLEYPVPPGYRIRRLRRRPKLERFTAIIDRILRVLRGPGRPPMGDRMEPPTPGLSYGAHDVLVIVRVSGMGHSDTE